MSKETARQIWTDLMKDGMPDQIASFLWGRVAENGMLLAFIHMLWTFAFRFLLIAFYFSLLYLGIAYIKKRLYKKLSVRVNYYCWYLLIFSAVLANLPFNNGFIALSVRLSVDPKLYMHHFADYACFALCLLIAVWLIVVVCKLLSLMRMNHKIQHSFKHMERYDDSEGLAARAALVLGLKKTPNIWVADYIYTPVSYGVFKKVILLPVDYEEKYSTNEIYLLLLHEMTHIKHSDTVKLYLASFVGCFLWLTPAMRLFIKSFKRDAELLCDHRVVGLQETERDAYGSLILKECAYKNARFGFGFSDSYHAVENRLDALYRYKANGHVKLLAFIPTVILMICAASFAFRTEWFVVNSNYNLEYTVEVLDSSSGEYIALSPDVSDELCEVENDVGIEGNTVILLKEDALRSVAKAYAYDGVITARVISNSYTVRAGETSVSSGYLYDRSISSLPPKEGEMIVNGGRRVNERSLAEYVFLWITSKL